MGIIPEGNSTHDGVAKLVIDRAKSIPATILTHHYDLPADEYASMKPQQVFHIPLLF